MVRPAELRSGLVAPRRSIRYDTSRAAAPEVPPAPKDTLILLQQTDQLSGLTGKACASAPFAENPGSIDLVEGGTPGTVLRSLTITTESIARWLYMGSALGAPGQGLWEAGTWTIRLNIATITSGAGEIRHTHICRVNSVGVNQGSVAFTEDINIPLQLGAMEWTLPGVETVGSASDRIQIVLGMKKTSAPGHVFNFLPDQVIETPILRAA